MRTSILLVSVLPLAIAAAVGPCAREQSGDRGVSVSDEIAAGLAPYAPPLVTRTQWQAKPPLPGMKAQKSLSIIIHHTGVAQNPKVAFESKMRNLQSYSQQPAQLSPARARPAWPDVPYHFYIDLSGHIAEGRDVRFAGDTNTNYDTLNHVQVAVEGDFEKEAPAPRQIAALKDLLVWLMLSSNVPPGKISVHKDHASTDCPGRNLIAVLPDVLAGAAGQRAKVITELCAGNAGREFAQAYCDAK